MFHLKNSFILTFATLSLLAMNAGCRNKTFEAPTEKTPIKKLDSESIDVSMFIENANHYAFKLARTNTVQNSTDNILVSPLNLYLLGLVVLNGSSGKTYEATANHLGVVAPDYTPLNIGANAWLTSSSTSDDFRPRNGIFMIWPIKLEKSFATRMAETLGADVIKLGAASLASQEALDFWLLRSTGEKNLKLNQPLDRKRDVILTLNTATLNASLAAKADIHSATKDGRAMYVGQIPNPDLELIWFEKTGEGPVFPTLDEFKELEMSLEPFSEQSLPDFAAETSFDLEPLFRETGFGSFIDGPNDLRYLALEINGDYPVAQNHHYVQIKTTGQHQTRKKELPFLIRERESGLILIVGKLKASQNRP